MKNDNLSKFLIYAFKNGDVKNSFPNFYIPSDIINYNTLGYILDPQNSSVYKKRVLDAIAYFDKTNPDTVYGIIYDKDGDNWNGSIPPGNTFASAVIALDIIYPSLTQKEIANLLGISRSYVSRIEKKALKKLGTVMQTEDK